MVELFKPLATLRSSSQEVLVVSYFIKRGPTRVYLAQALEVQGEPRAKDSLRWR